MRKLCINLYETDNRETLHQKFKEAFEFKEDYGNNLDALYDMLTEISKPMQLVLNLDKAFLKHDEKYKAAFLRMLKNAAYDNRDLTLDINYI